MGWFNTRSSDIHSLRTQKQFHASPHASTGLIKGLYIFEHTGLLEPEPFQLTDSFRDRHDHGSLYDSGQDGDEGVQSDLHGPMRKRMVVDEEQRDDENDHGDCADDPGKQLEEPPAVHNIIQTVPLSGLAGRKRRRWLAKSAVLVVLHVVQLDVGTFSGIQRRRRPWRRAPGGRDARRLKHSV